MSSARSWRRPYRGTERRSATGAAGTALRCSWCTARPPTPPVARLASAVRAARHRVRDGPSRARRERRRPCYSLENEAADVSAVVDAVADATGGPVDVFVTLRRPLRAGGGPGHHGDAPAGALRASDLLDDPARMARPDGRSSRAGPPRGGRDRSGRRSRRADGGAAGADKADPSWPHRVAAAHTVVRETRAEDDYRFEPARLAELAVPTMLLTGSDSPAGARRATAPSPRRYRRAGGHHGRAGARRDAHRTGPVRLRGPRLPPRRRFLTSVPWFARRSPSEEDCRVCRSPSCPVRPTGERVREGPGQPRETEP